MRTKTQYGVFKFETENRYRSENAIKIYKQKSAAEKFCDTQNHLNQTLGKNADLVVRTVFTYQKEN